MAMSSMEKINFVESNSQMSLAMPLLHLEVCWFANSDSACVWRLRYDFRSMTWRQQKSIDAILLLTE